jgi:hypothetical protein
MLIVTKINDLLAEFATFPVESDKQKGLVEQVIQNIESTLKPKPGFSAAAVFRSRDGLRVTSYVQWQDQIPMLRLNPFRAFLQRISTYLIFLMKNLKAVNWLSFQI